MGEEWTVHLRAMSNSRGKKARNYPRKSIGYFRRKERDRTSRRWHFIDSPSGRLVSLVNSYYNWRDCSNARRSRSATNRHCGSLDSLKSHCHLYKSCETMDARGLTYKLKFYRSTRELQKKSEEPVGSRTLPGNARTFGLKGSTLQSIEKVARLDRRSEMVCRSSFKDYSD